MKNYKLEKIDEALWRFYDNNNNVNLFLTNENAKKVYINSYNEKLKKIADDYRRLDTKREELELRKSENIKKEREKEKENKKIRDELKNIKYDENKAIVCVGVMQNVRKNESGIFVVRQKKGKKWMLPGGILDPPQKLNTSNEIILGDQEGVFSGLSREILEETGININGNISIKFRDYKYSNTGQTYNDKPLWACVVHMIVDFPDLITINNLFKKRTDHQNPTETTKWGFYNISDKTTQTIRRSSFSQKLQRVLVKSPEYRHDFTKNLNKVIDSCIAIERGIL
jgi:ADP-ribose pyrophosphatase YjhB (NUDIX family)